MNVYVVSPNVDGDGKFNKFLELTEKHHVALMGWNDGDEKDTKKSGTKFANVADGDLVIIANGSNSDKHCYFAGHIDSKSYYFNEDGVEVSQARKLRDFVDLRGEEVPFTTDCCNKSNPPNFFPSIYGLSKDNPADAKVIAFVENLIEKAKGAQMVQELAKCLEIKKNLILTGAPGTGKTYLARQIACSMVLNEEEKKLPEEEQEKLAANRMKFVQFHPSYDYTDFVEGLRPIQSADGQIGFRRQDGAFKSLCKMAIEAKECRNVNNFDEVWKRFIADLVECYSKDNPLELTTPSEKKTFRVFVNRYDNLSLITSGANSVQGTLTREKVWRHYIGEPKDDYWKCYFEGILSYLADEKNGYGLQHFVKGTTVELEVVQKFVMIIDEINRGDISKIFGELFYAIDNGYRGSRGRVETQYQNLVDTNDIFGQGFYVPENVYIIGTMNDVDRNVESMDFAIRRRFAWYEINPEDRFDAMMNGLSDSTGAEVPVAIIDEAKDRMNRLNEAIGKKKELGLGLAYRVGPSYFMRIKDYQGDDKARFEALWNHHLRILLCEYLRGTNKADEVIKELWAAYNKDIGLKDAHMQEIAN